MGFAGIACHSESTDWAGHPKVKHLQGPRKLSRKGRCEYTGKWKGLENEQVKAQVKKKPAAT